MLWHAAIRESTFTISWSPQRSFRSKEVTAPKRFPFRLLWQKNLILETRTAIDIFFPVLRAKHAWHANNHIRLHAQSGLVRSVFFFILDISILAFRWRYKCVRTIRYLKNYEKRELGDINHIKLEYFNMSYHLVSSWILLSLVVASFEIRGTLGSSSVSGSAKWYEEYLINTRLGTCLRQPLITWICSNSITKDNYVWILFVV